MNALEGVPAAPLLDRVRATFLHPGALPDLIRPGFPWLDVLLISTAVAVAGVAALPDTFFLDPLQEAVSRRGEPVEITSSPAVVARWGRALGMLATLATHPVVAVVLAGALTLVFGIFYRGPGAFRDYLSLACHALLIPALGTILSTIVGLIVGWDPAGTLLSFQPSTVAGHVLLAVDPFVVWMLIALGIGAQRIDPRRTTLQTTAILLAAYLILLVSSTALLHPSVAGS